MFIQQRKWYVALHFSFTEEVPFIFPTVMKGKGNSLCVAQMIVLMISFTQQVHFLNEETIIESIQKTVKAKLLGANSSRTFYTQVQTI